MKRIGMTGLALTIALAICGSMATAASAEPPEFGRCLKQATKALSNFDSAKCVKLASEDSGTEAERLKKGNYQWFPGVVNDAFTTVAAEGALATLETVGGTKITCTGETGTGEYTGAKTVGGVTASFSGCEFAAMKCQGAGEPVGKITTNQLRGVLGIWQTGATMAKDKPGISFTPASGELLAQFECGGLEVTVRGAVILPVPGNAMKLSLTEKLAQTRGRQKPASFVGGPAEMLEVGLVGSYEPAGLGFAFTQTNEEKVEVSTVQ